MNDKIYSFENEAGNETVIQQKKFLDAEGVKYLWSKINMQDYPNNQTLMQVIEAIDETKADINLQNIELTDEEINELKFKLKIPESLNYIYLGDTTSGYGYMCNMLSGIENYITIPPSYEQNHPNALSEMLAGMSAAIMQTSNKLYKNILPRITLNYPKLREAGMSNFIQFYFYTYNKNKKQCGSVEAVNLYYNTKNDIYTLSRISKINSLVSYGFLKFDGNNNVLHDATQQFDDTFTNDYVPASSGAIGRALNEKANKSDLFNGSWNDLNNKPFYKSELAFFKPRLPLTERFAFDMEDLFSMGAFEYPTIFNIGDTKIPGTLFVNCSEVTNQVDVHISFLSEDSELSFSGNALVSWPSELNAFEFTNIQGFTLDSDEQSLEIYHKMEKIWESVIPESIARVDQIPTQIQSDWNQNDEIASDYIKNRPFYSYPIEPILCDGTFIYETLPNGKIGIYLPDGFSLGEKQHYNITAVDFVYNNAYCESNNISWYVNRLNVVITYIEEDGKWAYWYDGGVVGESFYLKIEDARGSIGYKTIDIEYLPQSLGMPGSGENSWTFNYKDNIASGYYSIAEGQKTTASGGNSHAEGLGTAASGNNSHAEGWGTIASGVTSHAEGSFTIAASGSQHVQGQYNIEDKSRVYAHIVGNGKVNKRSNAHTIDWSGNAWYAGDIYVGSTSGTNKDDGSVKLARISDIPEELTEDEALQILIECEVIDPVIDENSNILLEQNNTILIY